MYACVHMQIVYYKRDIRWHLYFSYIFYKNNQKFAKQDFLYSMNCIVQLCLFIPFLIYSHDIEKIACSCY